MKHTWSLIPNAPSFSPSLLALFGDLPAHNATNLIQPSLSSPDLVKYFALPCSDTPFWSLATLSQPAPFILDSGCSVHISNQYSNFTDLHSITGCDVIGVGSSKVIATGLGNIQLQLCDNHTLVLKNALFIPTSAMRLISISCLINDYH